MFKSGKKVIYVSLIVASLLYCVLCGSLILLESRMIYPGAYRTDPIRFKDGDPRLQTVEYFASGNVPLQGRLLTLENPDHVVLYFHGNGERIDGLDARIAEISAALHASVLAAEFRGFLDDQEVNEAGVIADGLAAHAFLRDRFDLNADEIVIYGRSLGGGVAVAVAAEAGAKSLVLERTFDRLVDLASEKFWFVPVPWIMQNRFDSLARIAGYSGPLFQMHGASDSLIPITHAKNLYEASVAEPKRFLEIPGLGHNQALPKFVLKQLAEFLRAL